MMLLNVLLFLWFTRQFPVTERHHLELTQDTVKRLPLDDSATLCAQQKRSDGLPDFKILNDGTRIFQNYNGLKLQKSGSSFSHMDWQMVMIG